MPATHQTARVAMVKARARLGSAVSETPTRVHAVGIDLAWGNHPSGVAHLVGPVPGTGPAAQAPWRLLETAQLPHAQAVAAWTTSRVPHDAAVWIAVDAPLVATNPEGTQRAADLALSRDFRRFRVTCLPVDHRHTVVSTELVAALAEADIHPALPSANADTRRGIFETFPTAAHIPILDLHRPAGHKHGTVERRREGMRRLQTRLALLDDAALPLDETKALRDLLGTDPAVFRGAALKALEDRLDALICALVAALAWRAPARLKTYGDAAGGAITVPHPPAGPLD